MENGKEADEKLQKWNNEKMINDLRCKEQLYLKHCRQNNV